ncbi:MAG: DUF3877 family protein [Eubacteriales bacterium]|nr:DUF3877 family protein [Eubacteriales bacterium]
MITDLLEKHIVDTIKEWQIKIGFMPGNMKLYYPAESLKHLLGIPETDTDGELMEALNRFCERKQGLFGRILVSCDAAGERYCLDIPAKGTEYIATKVPAPEFLSSFLQMITKPGNTMEDVRSCFQTFAQKHGIQYREEDLEEEGLGHTFSFEENEIESYIYCIEEDAFGLTYHRFDEMDYKKMREEGHHHHE